MLQPPPKPTAEELKANAERAYRHNRNCVALEIYKSLLLRDGTSKTDRSLSINEAYELAEAFIEKGEKR